jgi:TolA-binding protein
MRMHKPILFVLALVLVAAAMPALAGPAPSKTAVNQSVASRDADLTVVRDVTANDQVARVLAAQGFSQEQVNQKLSQMSSQDLHQLARNLDQLQAAGLTKQEWIWIGIGAIAALILIIALTK